MPRKQEKSRDVDAPKLPPKPTGAMKASALSHVRSAHPLGGPDGREAVITRATEVIGDEQAAMRWLGTPVRALDYATPISRLNDPEGQAAVLNVLTQLEHGVL